MDEILEMYEEVKKGRKNQELFNYNNINIHFSQNVLNVYDTNGMPAGRYTLPKTEDKLIEKLKELDEWLGEIVDNNQYICGKCGEVNDLPEFKRTRQGVLICETCCNGGDIRKDKAPKTKNQDPREADEDENIPSTVGASKKPRLNEENAIELLRNNGYIVKKLVKSFKMVYVDDNGNEAISKKFFRSKEEFKKETGKKAVALIKELNEADEEAL